MSHPSLKYFSPTHVLPPHAITRPNQVKELYEEMVRKGWHGDALVGYWFNDQVQLLNGTHRRAAAQIATIPFIPIVVWPFKRTLEAWGFEEWHVIMRSGDGWGGKPHDRPVLLSNRHV